MGNAIGQALRPICVEGSLRSDIFVIPLFLALRYGEADIGKPYLDTIRETAKEYVAGLAALLQATPMQAQDNTAVENDLDTAMDFINGL